MKRFLIWIVILVTVSVSLAAGGRKKFRSEPLVSAITVTPASVTSPVTSEAPLEVCGFGFAEGNFVAVGVPWVGDPNYHSNLTFSRYIDETGSFCFTAPPAWDPPTQLTLVPGTYTIISRVAQTGADDTFPGPTAILVVE